MNHNVDYQSEGIPQDYVYNNFNDMFSGFVTLFELMIVNNWQVNVQAYVIAIDT